MVFKRLQDSQDSLYLQAMQLYQTSFPLHEQRKPDAQRAILQEPDYQFNLLMEEDHLLNKEESRSFWRSTRPSMTSPCAGKAFMNEPVIGKIRLHTSIRRIGRALQGIRWW